MVSKRLGTQILVLTVALALLGSITVLSSVWYFTARFTKQKTQADFNHAALLLEQLLADRQTQLLASAEVLTSDFGFKQAVVSSDSATIASVLENHSARIGADLMLLIDLDNTIQAVSGISDDSVGLIFDDTEALQNTLSEGSATAFITVANQLYQIIMLTVKAPVPIAYAGTGFQLDSVIAEKLKSLSSLHVSFIVASEGVIDTVLASTLAPEEHLAAFNADSDTPKIRLPLLHRQAFVTQWQTLYERDGSSVRLALSADLNELYASFDRLSLMLLIITLATLVLAVIGGALLSRNLTLPLTELTAVARQIAEGKYLKLPHIKSKTIEIRALLLAFEAMQNDIKQREQRIAYEASHDSLTGLLNRNHFIERVLAYIGQQPPAFAVVNINIIGFSHVNDTFGHKVGDDCLLDVAARIDGFGDTAVAARSGSDEFLLLLPFNGKSEQAVIDSLSRHLAATYQIGHLALSLRFNLGVACSPTDGDNAEVLIRRAGIALDHSRKFEQIVCFYQTGQEEAHLERLLLIDELKLALTDENSQLSMVYQPKKNLKTGGIDKCEALIRWRRDDGQYVSPEIFVALAEQSGLIKTLTDWVIRNVVQQTQVWHLQGLAVRVAINISAQDLERDDLLNAITDHLNKAGLAASAISFELTERDVMLNPEKAMLLMQRFIDQGYELSVDDYGIGQSSLAKLKQLPIKELKIDKSFILKLDNSEQDQIIVRSTIELGHSLELRVVAEGVESEAISTLLSAMGCDYIQGYHLARPMPAHKFTEWLQQYQQPLNEVT